MVAPRWCDHNIQITNERRMIMKVWLYYRLSRDEDAELNSLNNQRNILVEYANANNHEIVGAKSMNRLRIRRLMQSS